MPATTQEREEKRKEVRLGKVPLLTVTSLKLRSSQAPRQLFVLFVFVSKTFKATSFHQKCDLAPTHLSPDPGFGHDPVQTG